jgi:hypothetical protein
MSKYYHINMINEHYNTLLEEAGIKYQFPPALKQDDKCPDFLKEFHYITYHKGVIISKDRVFILTNDNNTFYKLLNNWNIKGLANNYFYIGI